MALVAEDGTGLPGATTIATRAELIAFAAQRGVTIPDNDAADVHLVLAMDYLATLGFIGTAVVVDQGTPFPRTYYLNAETDDLAFPNDSVPGNIKRAQLRLAVASFQGITLLDQRGAGRVLKSRDVGPLKRVYADASYSHAEVAGVSELLAPYLVAAGGFRLVTARA